MTCTRSLPYAEVTIHQFPELFGPRAASIENRSPYNPSQKPMLCDASVTLHFFEDRTWQCTASLGRKCGRILLPFIFIARQTSSCLVKGSHSHSLDNLQRSSLTHHSEHCLIEPIRDGFRYQVGGHLGRHKRIPKSIYPHSSRQFWWHALRLGHCMTAHIITKITKLTSL